MANVLNTDKQIAVIAALTEGSSIRAIERMTGVHRDTIMRLGGILTLADDGECKFRVGNAEYDFWQFRKLALEDILFTSVAKWRP